LIKEKKESKNYTYTMDRWMDGMDRKGWMDGWMDWDGEGI